MAAAHDYGDLHELIDRMEPEQVEELRRHAMRLVAAARSHFRVLRAFDRPTADLGARAEDVVRAALRREFLRSLRGIGWDGDLHEIR